jgi:hypothetical protein
MNLSADMTPSEEQLVILVEALALHGIEQHAVVRNPQLAKRLAACQNVSVGPLARSPATAYCLMPDVDVAHAHDSRAIQVGLLLALTRSVPYVVTYRDTKKPPLNTLTRCFYRRAVAIVCPEDAIADVIRDYVNDIPIDTVGDVPVGNAERNANDDKFANRLCAERMAASYLRIYRRAADRHSVPAMLL